jgi:hypothetical protein
MTLDQAVAILNRIYSSNPWPKPFNLLRGRELIKAGQSPQMAARSVRTTARVLQAFTQVRNPVAELFGSTKPDDQAEKDARQILGNLIVGRCAELTFEDIYREHTHSTELELRDLRESRSDTDYRLFNGKGRPVYRVNIKFHGSLFRRAKEMVGLEPDDCFALATYKIHGALQKQTEDELPYIFVIVSVPDLTAESIGAGVPPELLDFVAHVHVADGISRKRDIEDRVVQVLQEEQHPAFDATRRRIAEAHWYVLGAKKADKLLRKMLFERVFALRTRNFSRQFRGAELDMHFSLSSDLTPLTTYLDMLRDAGYPRVTTLLERGDY